MQLQAEYMVLVTSRSTRGIYIDVRGFGLAARFWCLRSPNFAKGLRAMEAIKSAMDSGGVDLLLVVSSAALKKSPSLKQLRKSDKHAHGGAH